MYTVVLMAALTSSSATPDFCFRCRCSCSCSCYCSSYCGCSCYCGGCCSYGCGCSCFGGCHRSVNFCHSCGGFACYGCYGCYGSCHCNCYGGWSCYGPAVIVPGERIPVDPKKKGTEEVSRAQVVVELPADAKLYIDGQLMKATNNHRVFSTPVLNPGQTYYYDLKAEVVREGKTVADTQRVHLRPGQTVRANFGDMTAPVATAQTKPE